MKKILFGLAIVATFISCKSTKKEIIATYDNGKPQIVYYVKENGDKKEKVKEEMYYEDGKVRYTGNFKDEKPANKWQFYYKNGKLFAEVEFGESKQLENAVWKFYGIDEKPLIQDVGQLRVTVTPDMAPSTIENIKGNVVDQIFLHPDFTLQGKGSLENGARTGKWIYWFPNGKLQTEGNFVNDLLEGEQKVYHDNGNVYYKGNQKNGVRVGIWEFFDKEGNLVSKQDFGEIIEK